LTVENRTLVLITPTTAASGGYEQLALSINPNEGPAAASTAT
jgi:hypothetical protein